MVHYTQTYISLIFLVGDNKNVYAKGERNIRLGACGTWISMDTMPHPFHTFTRVEGGVLDEECSRLLRDFFKGRRNAVVRDFKIAEEEDGAPPRRLIYMSGTTSTIKRGVSSGLRSAKYQMSRLRPRRFLNWLDRNPQPNSIPRKVRHTSVNL